MRSIASWVAALVIAVVLGQTLYFKFTAAPESVAIFTALGVEPWGRVLTGIVELCAIVLVLVPSTRAYGAVLAALVMIGAIGAHLFKLGVGGSQLTLFVLALVVLAAAGTLLWLHRANLPLLPRTA